MMRLACHGHAAVQEPRLGSLGCQRRRQERQKGRRPDHSQIHRSTSGWIMELGARMGIGPGGFEPPYPDPKSGVLPLDEGPATMKRLNLQTSEFSWKAVLCPNCARRTASRPDVTTRRRFVNVIPAIGPSNGETRGQPQ